MSRALKTQRDGYKNSKTHKLLKILLPIIKISFGYISGVLIKNRCNESVLIQLSVKRCRYSTKRNENRSIVKILTPCNYPRRLRPGFHSKRIF